MAMMVAVYLPPSCWKLLDLVAGKPGSRVKEVSRKVDGQQAQGHAHLGVDAQNGGKLAEALGVGDESASAIRR